MEKLKDLVRKRSSKSLHRKSRSIDRLADPRRSEDLPSTLHPASDKVLPPVPATGATTAHQPATTTPLRPSSQWGKQTPEQSPISPQEQEQQQRQKRLSSPIASASVIPMRDSSLRFNPASPPHIEQDYDQYRNMLAQSAAVPQRGGGGDDVFHDATEGAQAPASRRNQQTASRDYGRRQIHATNGNDLKMQGLSIADDATGIGRASTDPVPMNEANQSTRSTTDPLANMQKATARKALPPRPQENMSPRDQQALRHKSSDPALQDAANPQTQSQASYLPNLDQHPKPTTISAPSDPNHTFSTSSHPDPLARLPPSFNPTNTTDTTVSTTVAPAVTHETRHTKRIEIFQEAITRDIHVDHYYHYVQPLKVVEVNPAQHFRINSKGEKLSIAAPEGWQMPTDMSVRRAPDFVKGERGAAGDRREEKGKLGWSRRDYVVDEQYPKGRMLNKEELEQERVQGHLASPAGVGSGGGSVLSSPVRDKEPGLAR